MSLLPSSIRPVAWILVIPLLLPALASATPRYALRVGQKCSLCHQNPSGGGMRSTYASQYLIPEEIARPIAEEGAWATDPQIGPDMLIGADLRTVHLNRSDTDFRNNFVQMQGALYVSLQLNEKFSAYIHEELGQGDASAAELYGLGYVLPAGGYVKVGRFVPPFGWRVPDHRAFTRRDFVFLPSFPPHSDTGLEVGFHPGPVQLQVAVLNGAYRSALDTNNSVAVSTRGSISHAWGSMNLTAGGSYYQNDGLREDVWVGGPFGGLSWDRVTWLGEVDWAHRKSSAAITTSLTSHHEVAVEISQGFDAVGTYDFHDPDVNLTSGAVHRIGFGLDTFPYPFLQVRARLNLFRLDDGPALGAVTGYLQDFEQSIVEIHFLY